VLNDKIYSVDLMWSGLGGDISITDNFRRADARLQKVYQVFTTPDASLNDVLQAPGIPAAGSSFGGGFDFVFAVQASPKRQSPVYWIVTVPYEGEVSFGSGGPQGNQNNGVQSPLLAPAIIDFDDVEEELEIDEDFDGNPLVTANGEPVNGIRRKFADQTVTIQKNMLTFSSYVQGRYRHSVNSDTFLQWPAGTAKMQKLRAKAVASPETPFGGYYQVTAVIQFRYPYRTTPEKAWYSRSRHEGYYKRVIIPGAPPLPNGDPKTEVVRATRAGEPTAKPVLLDEKGFQLPDVDPPAQQTAFWQEKKLYEPLSYNALGLLP
jgi:hypothetical protein